MKKLLLYIVILFTLSSCHMRPFNVLNKEQMANVIFDLHLTESTIAIRGSGTRRIEKQTYYNHVFEKHHITKQQFD